MWKHYKANNGKGTYDRPSVHRSKLTPNTVNEFNLGKYPGTVHYTGNQNKYAWDHPLYWVAQMFEKNWYPHETYQRETIPASPFPTPISTSS